MSIFQILMFGEITQDRRLKITYIHIKIELPLKHQKSNIKDFYIIQFDLLSRLFFTDFYIQLISIHVIYPHIKNFKI